MTTPTARRIPRKARNVLRYFVSHPKAVADLEDVARWRLLEETVHNQIDEVDAALRWLVAHRYLVRDSVLGSKPVSRARCVVDDAGVKRGFVVDKAAALVWIKEKEQRKVEREAEKAKAAAKTAETEKVAGQSTTGASAPTPANA